MKWIEALKVWNTKKGGMWCVPKKDTEEYKAVRHIMDRAKPEAVEARNVERRATSIAQLREATKDMKPGVRKIEEPNVPEPVVKEKRKYTKKPKSEPMAGAGADMYAEPGIDAKSYLKDLKKKALAEAKELVVKANKALRALEKEIEKEPKSFYTGQLTPDQKKRLGRAEEALRSTAFAYGQAGGKNWEKLANKP